MFAFFFLIDFHYFQEKSFLVSLPFSVFSISCNVCLKISFLLFFWRLFVSSYTTSLVSKYFMCHIIMEFHLSIIVSCLYVNGNKEMGGTYVYIMYISKNRIRIRICYGSICESNDYASTFELCNNVELSKAKNLCDVKVFWLITSDVYTILIA